jgi:hypothetical protein
MLVFFPVLLHLKSFNNVIHISLIILYISIVGPLGAFVLELYIKMKYSTFSLLKIESVY